MRVHSFEKLIVWQKSRELTVLVYKITKGFSNDERYGLVSQMRRCAVSISSNIAEGTGRRNSKDKARFTELAWQFLSYFENFPTLLMTKFTKCKLVKVTIFNLRNIGYP